MGSKFFSGEKRVIRLEHDFALENKAIGAHVLADLPTNFIITSVHAQTVGTLTAGASLVIGEDGGGDADGYCTDIIAGQADLKVVRGEGALVYNSTDKRPLTYPVVSTKDGLQITIGTAAVVAGKLIVYIEGIQAN